MNDPVMVAVANSARWCDLVCRSNGIPTQTSRAAWAAQRRPPQLYPDAVTLLPDAPAADVLEAVEASRGCSVKDSFANMELDRYGFDELFEARWIYRAPARTTQRSRVSWTVVEREEEFDAWVYAAGIGHAVGSDLVRDSTVRFLSAPGPDGPGAGAIVNCTGNVVGLSNVFSSTIAIDDTWASLPDACADAFPSRAIVGYEHGEALEAALASGFSAVGPLRVWLRTIDEQA